MNLKEKNEFQKKIKTDLKELADLKYKDFHSNLCPGTTNILGVRVPVLRKYAKKCKEQFSDKSYRYLDDEFYEEIMLQGMLLGLEAGKNYEENKKELDWFIPKIDNWAICDVCIGGFKFIEKNLEEYWDFIKSYIQKENEFEKRFAYVTILSYYIKEEYIDEVLELLVKENSTKYYVQMAVAWALSICLIKYYDKTMKALKNSNLNVVTYNKALQKACESYRIPQEKKEELRQLKKIIK